MNCIHDPLYFNDGRCSKCYPPKRVVMVQHADGAQEIATKWSSDAERAAWKAEGDAQAQRLANEMGARYDDWRYGEHGAGCAGNSADEYDSASEGHW